MTPFIINYPHILLSDSSFKLCIFSKQKCKHEDKLLKLSNGFQGESATIYKISEVNGTYNHWKR